jgi:hypothetical protein
VGGAVGGGGADDCDNCREGAGLNFAVAAANLPASAEAVIEAGRAGRGRFNCVSCAGVAHT